MTITIAQRLHPFSHENGTKFLLPRTTFLIQVFPTALYFTDIEGKVDSFSLSFDFVGPIVDFTAELNLERGHLSVFGMAKKGFMRYHLLAKKEGVLLTMEKIPEAKLVCRRSFSPQPEPISKGESILIPFSLKSWQMENKERLSLGEHKAQDWALIRRRLDFKEVFPIWLSLSHWFFSESEEASVGNYLLLKECQRRIEAKEKEHILDAFQNLFLSSFEGVLVPRLYDTEHQGILPENRTLNNQMISPLPLLIKGAQLIRSLFVQEKEENIAILPCLPPQFHCGRMIGVECSNNIFLDFEWTKKSLRRMQITSLTERDIHLNLPKGIQSCRIKKGRRILKSLKIDPHGNLALSLAANETIQIDRFEK